VSGKSSILTMASFATLIRWRGSFAGTASRRQRIAVLLEMSVSGGRTGCRSSSQALEIAAAIAASPVLQLVGVAGYEGALGAGRDAAGIARVRDYCQMLIATAALVAGKGCSAATLLFSAPEAAPGLMWSAPVLARRGYRYRSHR
jgi:D-serine deaminase-like pyridoxal phosphate-dependent protein